MNCAEVVFSGHAVRRMFERGMSEKAILGIIASGEVIADYPDDRPYPSWLILGLDAGEPVHVLVAREAESQTCFVVTAYYPDPDIWSDDFKVRR